MKRKILLLFYFVVSFTLSFAQEYYTIYSGSYDKPYNETANEIVKVFEDQLDSTFHLSNLSSLGSYENFNKLESGQADFIIAQRDIAVQNYYLEEKTIKNFEVVLPLFPEMLQIFVKREYGLLRVDELELELDQVDEFVIAAGDINTSSYKTTKKLVEVLFHDYTNIVFDTRPIDEAYDVFISSSEIDMITYFAAPPLKSFTSCPSDSLSMLSLTENDLAIVLSHDKSLEYMQIESDLYEFCAQADGIDKIGGIGTWAFLLQSAEVGSTLQSSGVNLSAILIESFINNERETFKPNYIKHGYEVNFNIDTASNLGIYDGVDYDKFFMGLPLSENLSNYINVSYTRSSIYSFLSIVGILFILFIYLRWYIPSYKIRILIFQYSHSILLFFLCIGCFLAFSYILGCAENSIFAKNGIRGPFINLKFYDILQWLLINVFADHNSNIFPVSFSGKIIATISKYIVGAVVMFVGVNQFYIYYIYNKRKLGKKIRIMDNQIVIVGWNDYVIDILNTYIDAFESKQLEKKNILLINDKLQSVEFFTERLSYYHINYSIQFKQGDVDDAQLLEKVRIDKADTILIIADDKSAQSDRNSLLRALAISDYCKNVHHELMDKIYMIAEVNERKYFNSLQNAGVNEILCTTEISNKLMVQSSVNHGLSRVVGSLLTYDDDNEFYTIKLSDYRKLVGHTFDELLIKLRENEITLIAIQVNFMFKKEPVIDRNEINKRLKNLEKYKKKCGIDSLEKDIIINPSYKSDAVKYKVDKTDYLIVLADSEQTIIKNLDNERKSKKILPF